ncbi:hypothetical protein FTO74_14440 [Granulicella sp. WH15]|uniref:hypothetical protein n=1 Tax=Granulicella sp. WH15 TaxID=2602070 RepID=UPI001366C5F4|nr:hypothetical protein [Granulicella sp. WH15]QHN04431.1 hypothetical protein FTO74_14440 [Granulicella sp. WH15]
MAETDIFNPLDWQTSLDFNPNPAYMSELEPGSNSQILRPRLGGWFSRDLTNTGHSFSLQWNNLPLSIVQRIKQFYHSYKDGYFTLIDIDGGGRHYVGRFTNVPKSVQTANGKYSIQGLTFEEYPTARMVQYPSDFDNDGHSLYVADDNLRPRVALMQGAWAIQISPTAPAGSTASMPSALEAYDAAPVAGTDWAQMGYVGWGFSMTFRLGATLGVIDLYLDNVLLVSGLNLSSGAVTQLNAPAGTSPNGSTSLTVEVIDVPLDSHRIKIMANAASGAGKGILFPPVTYIY